LWPLIQRSDVATSSELHAVVASQPTPGEPQPVEPVAAPVEQTPVSAPVSAPAATAPTAAEVRVRLEFTEPSWIEIYDANGQRLMFDMGTPGRVRTVAGVPPLRVSLGLASAVSAQINDQPVVIPRRAGRDGAKFLIEADGAVRPDSLKTAERE
jgi:cytoskeleton protein RodZ